MYDAHSRLALRFKSVKVFAQPESSSGRSLNSPENLSERTPCVPTQVAMYPKDGPSKTWIDNDPSGVEPGLVRVPSGRAMPHSLSVRLLTASQLSSNDRGKS